MALPYCRNNGSVDPSTCIHKTKSFSNPWDTKRRKQIIQEMSPSRKTHRLTFLFTNTNVRQTTSHSPGLKPGGCVNGRMEMHFTFQESGDVKNPKQKNPSNIIKSHKLFKGGPVHQNVLTKKGFGFIKLLFIWVTLIIFHQHALVKEWDYCRIPPILHFWEKYRAVTSSLHHNSSAGTQIF